MVRFGVTAAVLAMMAAPLFAQESTEQLKKELEQLRAEVDGLKAVNSTREIPSQGKIDADAMAADESPVMTLFKGSKLSGYVEAAFGFSFNQLNTNLGTRGGTGNNPVRFYDNSDNAFYLHCVQLQLERLATKDMIVGYHVELQAGHDPTVSDGAGLILQEGWIQILVPVGGGLDIRAGRMATLCGYEVPEAPSNMNYSRGLLWSLIQPITHTGVRAAYSFTEMVTMTLGFNNGQNSVSGGNDPFADENHGKGFEWNLLVKPIKDLMIALTINVGSDGGTQSNSTHDRFYLIDLVIAYTMDKLTLALNYDNASIEGVGNVVRVLNGRSPISGIALYAKYQVTDIFATILRVEYMGVGLQNPGVVGADSGTGIRVVELTLTQEIKIAGHAIFRIELRRDDSNQHIFVRNVEGTGLNGAARGDTTLAFDLVLPF